MSIRKRKNQTSSDQGESSSSTDSDTTENLVNETPPIQKHPHPKILLIDLDSQAEVALEERGYNVSSGTFGKRYRVTKSDDRTPVIVEASLPNYPEQEIVIIDLTPREPANGAPGEKQVSKGELDWWVSCSNGLVDPRARAMLIVSDDFNRILRHGGVFVVFAHDRGTQSVDFACITRYGFAIERSFTVDNWSFLSILNKDNLEVSYDSGTEISTVEPNSAVTNLLSQFIKEASFECVMRPTYHLEKAWATLAQNKYGSPVSGIIFANSQGLIFIFPQIEDKAGFLAHFIDEVLPDLSPHLFPHFEGAKWVQRSEYELPKVVGLKNEITQIQEAAREQVAILEKAIEEERVAAQYLYDLLRETGDPLVASVKLTFETLGFQSVVDMDQESKDSGDSSQKHEDLQIRDGSPLLLVEVKGIAGLPKDAAALQVSKYLAPRMRELKRTDIHGLSVINHQKNLPGLDRENKAPFREEILVNAQHQGFALITSWDLYRLTRCFLKYGWSHLNVRDLFYKAGRIDPVPSHYEFVGVIEHFWEQPGVVGVRIQEAELNQGDRIAFDLPIEFEEQEVESLQVEKEAVSKAEIGMLAGIKTHLGKDVAKKGLRVFRIKR